MSRQISPYVPRLIMLVAGLMVTSACGGRQTTTEKMTAAREQITEIVKNPECRQKLLVEVDRWDALLTENAQSDAAFIANRDALNVSYTATEADFELLKQKRAADIQKMSNDFINIRQIIIANTTADEWKALRSTRDELRHATATPTTETGAKP